jgi:3-oxoadipate enol-lactonase
MLGATQQITQVEAEPGVRLAVEAAGDPNQPTLLLSNSLAADMTMWDEIVARVADQFRIVRYDARGHGRSDVPVGPYTIERLGRDALAIMDALDIRRAVFCGMSLGGLTGMWLGASHGERFDGLVLANTAASFAPAKMWHDRAEQVRANGVQPLVGATMERWLTKAYRENHPGRSAASARWSKGRRRRGTPRAVRCSREPTCSLISAGSTARCLSFAALMIHRRRPRAVRRSWRRSKMQRW